MHRSATFYEQCYAMDADRAQPAERKGDCWDDWLVYYSGDQPSERVRFATERRSALRTGASTGIDTTPPPVTLTPPADAPVAEVTVNDRPPTVPASAPSICDADCTSRWDLCIARCEAPDLDACRTACRAERRVCLHACD